MRIKSLDTRTNGKSFTQNTKRFDGAESFPMFVRKIKENIDLKWIKIIKCIVFDLVDLRFLSERNIVFKWVRLPIGVTDFKALFQCPCFLIL